MAEWHLSELAHALRQRGWRIVSVHPGDDYRVSATWEVRRSTKQPSQLLDFDGMDASGDFCVPIEQSYGCDVRGVDGDGLYFHRNRREWDGEVG